MDKHLVKISSFLLFSLLYFHPLFTGLTPRGTLLKTAQQDYFEGNTEDILNKINQVLDREPENPTANILHGLILLQEETVFKRLEAKKIIEKYAAKIKNDAFANYALGVLYKKQNILRNSRKYFKKALDCNEAMVPAMIELGENYYRDMLRYYHRYTDTDIALSYRRFAMEDYDFAVSYLRRARRYDPRNKGAAALLGSLYYETEEYNLMRELFEEMHDFFPEDKDVNLFLGLAYLSQRKYDNAFEYFTNAMIKLDKEERKELFSPAYLSRKKEDIATESQIENFWDQRDPMFITRENERLLEHFGRFAYANLRFSAPKLKREGWQTDRGKTYIRYGKPQYIIEYGKSMEFNAIYPPMQIWIYSRFQLAFSDEFWNGLFQFTEPSLSLISIFKERTNVNYTLVAENVFSEISESFDFSLSGGTFNSPYQIKFFKESDKTEGLLYFGIPIQQKLYYPEQELESAIFVLNDQKLPDSRFNQKLDLHLNHDSLQIIDNFVINKLTFRHDAGLVPYSFEIINKTLEMNFVDRREMIIPDFTSDSLLISDILVANQIIPATEAHRWKRNGLYILPNILQLFESNDTLAVYFEIYNLIADENGYVQYRVENAISKKEAGGILRSIFGKQTSKLSIVNEYTGQQTTDYVVQSIHLNNLDAGEYDFEIIVYDDIAKEETRRATKILLLDHVTN